MFGKEFEKEFGKEPSAAELAFMCVIAKQLQRLEEKESAPKIPLYEQIKNLTETTRLFLKESEPFVPGQLVVWKPNLRNRRLPSDEQVGIVVEVLDSPVYDDEHRSSGNPWFREPLDIIIGLMDDEGDYLTFHVDSRRLQPYLSVVEE